MLVLFDSANDSFNVDEVDEEFCLALCLRFYNRLTSNGPQLLTCNVNHRTPKSLHEIAVIFLICFMKSVA